MFNRDSYGRITSTNNFIPEIDALRFIAIFPVVCMHALSLANRFSGYNQPSSEFDFIYSVFRFGQNGVFLFFAISGFILSIPFIKSNLNDESMPNLKNYYLRRITRLEPPFIIYMVSIYLCMLLLKYFTSFSLPINLELNDSLAHFIAGLTYTHFLVFGNWDPINPVTWSLEVEIQFYLLMPFLMGFLLKRGRVFCYIFIFLLIFLFPIVNDIYRLQLVSFHLNKSLITYGGFFMAGVVLAFFYYDIRNFFKGKSYIFDLLFIISIFLTFNFESYWLVIFGIFGLFISVFKSKLVNKLITLDFFTIIGGMCYTIYLLHFPILVGLAKILKRVLLFSPYLYLIISCIIVLVLSSILFIWFERPFMKVNWIKKYFPKYI